jgi:hypothetical protein
VFWYRKAETLVATGDIEPALTIARTLSRKFLDAGDRLGKYSLLLMLCVADLCLACGDAAQGRRIAESGRRTAQLLDDVLFERECLGLLRKCAESDDERQALDAESRRLAEVAWLGAASLPSVDPAAPCRFAAMDDLYERLMAFAEAPLQRRP